VRQSSFLKTFPLWLFKPVNFTRGGAAVRQAPRRKLFLPFFLIFLTVLEALH
jgi:hypothetical protein